ncbi:MULTISPECIES: FAD-dependent oxidoreductase [unclassified Jeotgalibaca]|uniref:FAD-dependent oxidoreductase n=1 Tax=unclassified Jeotgalibaca TaxID=2621505 RepID=UPI003FCFC94A
MKLSAHTRLDNLKYLQENELDILVIGGGITGAGIALHGSLKGLKIGLIEMQDFAAGTSSRSTKLVHGGLRYLKNFEVELVANVARERAIIHHNAPHIVQPRKMLLPVYEEPGASFNDFSAEIVLDLYDKLGEVTDDWRHSFISKEKVLEDAPGLRKEGLLKGGLYLDYLNDDARLTISILKSAHYNGAKIANYVKAVGFIYGDDKQIKGIKAVDQLTEEAFSIHAKIVVNATGPWSDETRNMQKSRQTDRMLPTKGVHFVVDGNRLPVRRTIYTDSGLEDNRMIFIIPRKGKTYFGTTDTPYKGDLLEPKVTQEDVDYLLEAINFRFPDAHLTIDDIETAWSGLRPLIQPEGAKSPSEISREHEIFVSEEGLVTIGGGKLTDYRLMAEDTFVVIDALLDDAVPEVDSERVHLSGGEIKEGHSFEEYRLPAVRIGQAAGLSERDAVDLVNWYGTDAEKVFSGMEKIKNSRLPVKDALSLQYAMEYEMTLTLEDYFLRRVDTLLFEFDRMRVLVTPALEQMTAFYQWDEEKQQTEKEKVLLAIEQAHLTELR